MIDGSVHPATGEDVAAALREELSRADAGAGTRLLMLQDLIAGDETARVSEEILARVRGMVGSLATELAESINVGASDAASLLTSVLIENTALLSYLHAAALEWQLIERLQTDLALDEVASPLLQALLAHENEDTRSLAMTFLAAQARWCSAQRHMKLPLRELPEDLLHGALLALGSVARQITDVSGSAEQAASMIRQSCEGYISRLVGATRLIDSAGDKTSLEFGVAGAGVALFLTALAMGAGTPREAIVMATQEGQSVRLALALRAAGMEHRRTAEQLLAFHPEAKLPSHFHRIEPDLAAAILSTGQSAGDWGG